jgi:2,4-dienoyl-CoA reductase-like NADH-dependent reductase (Old Yellow Enzyme family)
MCQYIAYDDGMPHDWHYVHYGAFARGGVGLVMVEATGVTPDGRITPGCLGLYNDEQEAEFARIVKLIKSHGATAGIQLAHSGRKGSTYRWHPGQPEGYIPVAEGGWETMAPSAIAASNLPEPKEMTLEDIEEFKEAFFESARRAVRAGFEVIEVHSAHGYMLFSFLSPLSNKRTDQYGGSPENRARLLREIVQGLRAEHTDMPILVRISGTEWLEDGFTPKDSALLSTWLHEDGVDLVDCSSAANVPAKIPIAPGYQVHIADAVRNEGGMPSSAVGLIIQSAQAETILQTGQADIITVGRPLMANSNLPILWASELRADNIWDFIPKPYSWARFTNASIGNVEI